MGERSSDPAILARTGQLTRLSRAFTNARSLDEIFQLAVEQAAQLLGTDRALLMLTDDDGLLRVRAAQGINQAALDRFADPLTESLVSRLLGLLGAQRASGFVGVPLVTRGTVVGLLAAVRLDGTVANPDDEAMLSALADQLSAPLENARLARELERSVLLADNVRLYEAEREARLLAEAALREAQVARDIAVRADTTKTQFLAAMSHELRTPLNAIGGYVDLLAMGLRGPVTPEQAADFRRIKASRDHLLRLINDVLEYARLGPVYETLQLYDVDLDAVLHEAEVMIAPQAQAKRISYSFAPVGRVVLVRADAHLLKQVVLNLLSNAIKFTASGGSVSMIATVEQGVDSSASGRIARVDVRDTGRGIPSEQIDAIFEPFVQLGRTLNHPGEGVGLGLAISRDLARRLGGELRVTSEVGVGSTFTLTLPLVPGSD
ncbi:MAG: GAF domain-containing sensor histidine kinase [Gemmatimonadaceae bacterium]|nr:GAF domain-containing sensor histidine kinase [Gemmatimonadaceae bacterium]NUO95885.1 GAF domain-containing sensor histidine kinase [Gemmatimonadaceae bacterium]NUP54534.1 GAF domain-containing sensor histidine kinase [Gemmatimonadaceae bacterium]NUP69666.1 GAF domain-containing sensor histidine kinase [Gemmatimonadaceae bacterium]NUR34257.1 GAF domain-containing sensor histidine kinase [Gemmatimonadaceae bacterium]